MTSYDSHVFQQDANALFSLASEQVAKHAAAGAVFAWAAVFFFEPVIRNLLHLPSTYSLIPLQILAGLIAAILGGVYGYEKGLALKLQAQTALCHRQVEKNTRHLAGIEHEASRLVKIEEHIIHLEERTAVPSLSR